MKITVLEKSWVPGFQIPVLEKNHGYRYFKITVLEKNPGYRDFKSSTENRVESLYNREIFRALRAHPKPLPVSYENVKVGCPWG